MGPSPTCIFCGKVGVGGGEHALATPRAQPEEIELSRHGRTRSAPLWLCPRETLHKCVSRDTTAHQIGKRERRNADL